MKQILSAAAVALAFTASMSGQATPPSSSQTQSTAPSAGQTSSKAHKKMSSKSSVVTLTGCLREGDTPGSFELQNVEVASMSRSDASSMHGEHPGSEAASSSASSSSASGGGTSMGMSGEDMSTVKLLATSDIDLKPHVGHRVEVRGSMAGPDSGKMTRDKSSATSDTMGSGSSASSSSATGTSGADRDASKQNAHTLRIRSFRHISESCSQ